MFKTIVSIIIMALAGVAGLFLGALFNDAVGGMTLLVLLSGIACIIHTIDNKNS